ncbi:MAG: PorV/PorQ family protein [Chloroherpetonaceae bacterium]|nr:PorV/PorQ family protein [Chloroherpetonaceae bacterium]MDW8437082.1 PorV/PorQ family protein [Chloroherpetonaceae bacterium]
MRFIFSFSICLSLVQAATGQTVIGKYAGEFLALGVGGRQLGMGGAAVALASDVTSGYWNPAGLAAINYPQFAFMHAENFGGIVSYDYAAAAIPFQTNKSFGVSIIRLGVADIPDTRGVWDASRRDFTDDAKRIGVDALITRFNAADYAAIFSYSARSDDRLSYGINAKVIYRNIGSFASAKGLGFDIGAIYRTPQGVLLGASIQDVTTTLVSWSTGRNELIAPTAKLGAGYALEALYGRIMLGADADVRFEGRRKSAPLHLGNVSFNFRGGAEYAYDDAVALRLGIDDIGRVTLGAGVRLSKLNIDYAFAKFDGADQLGNSHRISLQIELDQEEYRRMGYVPPASSSEQSSTREE